MDVKKKEVGVVLIATGKYDIFLPPLIDSMDKYFFTDRTIAIYLFTDKDVDIDSDYNWGITINKFKVPSLAFPYPTLYRYRWITEQSGHMKADYIFYMDVDMLFVDAVGEEILPDSSGLVAVHHPGYYAKGGWGDNKTSKESTAFISAHRRGKYYAGGFQGGKKDVYLSACAFMDSNIAADEKKGVMACWHDESHWNKYLARHRFKALTPAYCMVEEMELRERWGIADIPPKIMALKKDHNKLRT